jgi:long-chain acyl-CoA synthetase
LGEEVGAAVVLRAGATADPAALRNHAAETLARHEVPARWWLHPGPLPTNPSGKVLRREVRAAWMSAVTPDVEEWP